METLHKKQNVTKHLGYLWIIVFNWIMRIKIYKDI